MNVFTLSIYECAIKTLILRWFCISTIQPHGEPLSLEKVIAWPLEQKSSLIVKIWRREVRTALPAWLVEDSVEETWRTMEMLLCLESQRLLVPIFVDQLQRSETTAGNRNSSGFKQMCSFRDQVGSLSCEALATPPPCEDQEKQRKTSVHQQTWSF